jgi:hypothetical protein
VSDRPERGALSCLPAGTLAATDRGAGGVRTEVCPADPALSAAVTTERAARTRLGAALADNPALSVGPEAAAALRAGAVDPRLLDVLTALSVEHRFGIDAFPTTAVDDPAAPARRVRLSTVDGAPASGDPLPLLRSWLGSRQPPFAPSVVQPDGPAVLVGYPAPGGSGLLPPP